ncbi:hypothetical protein [Pedobacter steynii]|nr:hypothetical protein [Pedobacter steynii]
MMKKNVSIFVLFLLISGSGLDSNAQYNNAVKAQIKKVESGLRNV